MNKVNNYVWVAIGLSIFIIIESVAIIALWINGRLPNILPEDTSSVLMILLIIFLGYLLPITINIGLLAVINEDLVEDEDDYLNT